jgi:hypothetical protein
MNFFGKKTQPISTIVTFDETYCHSAGITEPNSYKMTKGTTELRFVFPDFDAFWATYVNRNPAFVR